MSVREILSQIDENTTVEEARRIVAEALDELNNMESDITGYQTEIATMTDTHAADIAEIDRLREENGRLFRERIAAKVEEIKDTAEEAEEKAVEAEEELEKLITI